MIFDTIWAVFELFEVLIAILIGNEILFDKSLGFGNISPISALVSENVVIFCLLEKNCNRWCDIVLVAEK